MRPTSLLRTFVFFLAGLSAAAGQTKARTATSTTSPFRITGTVVSSTNGAPVPHCRLTPTLVGRGRAAGRQFPAPLDTFEADEHGHFSIPLPSAGAWHLSASARGFVTQAYDEHEQFSSAIVLTAEMPTFDLTFPLPEESVISGAVVDEAGEAVRNARIVLVNFPAPGPEGTTQPLTGTRAVAQTDDRGVYELANLPPGDYRLMVQAQPWYAVAAQARRGGPADPTPIDPSLDVVYPATWFPGADDAALAETITLHAGESRQADFHLIPIPSVHLRILTSTTASNATPNGRQNGIFPIVERINQGPVTGGFGFQPTSMSTNAQGQVDVGGLAPGTYQVRLQGPGQEGRPAVVELTAGSVRTLDLSAPPPTASITLHFEGLTDPDDESVQVNLIDPETGRTVSPGGGQGMGGPGNLRRRTQDRNGEQTLEVPPGRYQVVLRGRQNLYLTRLTAQSAEVVGRYVTVHAGPSTLTLHVASGRPTLTGVAKFQDKPSVGAMVMLVPATLDDARSLAFVRRDQSNTDGSFDLPDVIPGKYILVAIDHGWHINWSDPSTLRSYLTHGVPIDLTSSGNVKQNIEAEAP